MFSPKGCGDIWTRAILTRRNGEQILSMIRTTGSGLLLAGVGTHLSVMVMVGFAFGFGLDYLIDTTPVFMLIFGILGFVGGILRAIELLNRFK